MSDKRSRDEFMTFLDWMGQKGLIPKATAQTRKASAKQILSVLSEDEARDVTSLDIDGVVSRFVNLQGKGYSPGSVAAYKSRMLSALGDFQNYLDNPLGFKPNKSNRDNKPKAAQSSKKMHGDSRSNSNNSGVFVEDAQPQSMPTGLINVLPIPLRANLTVQIGGLPFDLTPAEAKRIANVVLAMAMSE